MFTLSKSIAEQRLVMHEFYKLAARTGWKVNKKSAGTDDGDDPARIEAIADILGGLFGDDALKFFAPPKHEKAWNETDHPRGKNGKFMKRGGSEAVETAHAKVKEILKGGKTAETHKQLIDHLSILTTKQLHEIKRKFQLSAGGENKEALRNKIAERLGKSRAGDDTPEPAEKVPTYREWGKQERESRKKPAPIEPMAASSPPADPPNPVASPPKENNGPLSHRLKLKQEMRNYKPDHGKFPAYQVGQTISHEGGIRTITSVSSPENVTHEDAGVLGRYQNVVSRPATATEAESHLAKEKYDELELTLKADSDMLIPPNKRAKIHQEMAELARKFPLLAPIKEEPKQDEPKHVINGSTGNYYKRHADTLKQIGGKWNSSIGRWIIPASAASKLPGGLTSSPYKSLRPKSFRLSKSLAELRIAQHLGIVTKASTGVITDRAGHKRKYDNGEFTK